MRLFVYGDTSVFHYWERFGMTDHHTCYKCSKPIVSTDKVRVLNLGLDDEETFVVCAKCAHRYR